MRRLRSKLAAGAAIGGAAVGGAALANAATTHPNHLVAERDDSVDEPGIAARRLPGPRHVCARGRREAGDRHGGGQGQGRGGEVRRQRHRG